MAEIKPAEISSNKKAEGFESGATLEVEQYFKLEMVLLITGYLMFNTVS
jgi:hypothetical protein